ncbi:MAG: Gfo/Idh/MocA family oxidoreductase [Victivallales bacterium]|nr:Gfo/Idh/MocA family oxidoreductase [Victivallales bacterium]
MDSVKIGIIGIGNMGSMHAKWLKDVPGAELTAVCDINPEAFKRLGDDLRAKVQCFNTPEEFFAKSGCELVQICVPHYAHPDLAIAAMKAGMHFILEKPICVHKAEAERLLAECKKYPNLVKSAMFNQRTRDAHVKIKELLDSGELGEIRRVTWIITDWFRTQQYYDSGDWRASWRGEGGGVLTNQCPHQLDLLQWFFGMPKLVDAHIFLGKYHNIEVEDEVNAYLEYPNGATGNFITTTGEAVGANRFEAVGEHGRLVFENDKLTFYRHRESTTDFIKNAKVGFGNPYTWTCELPYAPDNAGLCQHMRIVKNVIDVIRNGAKLIAPVEEGIRGLELANAMMLSGFLKQPVELPIDSKVYAEKLEKLIATSRYTKKPVTTTGNAAGFGNSF